MQTVPKPKSPVDYIEVDDSNRAIKTTRDERQVQIGQKVRTYRLIHSTAGYECAGSMARWTDGYFAVLFESDGATNGRRFKTEAEAMAMLDKWASAA